MYLNMPASSVPIYEAKNRLPYYIHQAEENAPVRISRHNEVVAYIVSKEDFESAFARPRKKSIIEEVHEKRIAYGLEDDDFDLTGYFDSLRERSCYGRSDSDHLFDEV